MKGFRLVSSDPDHHPQADYETHIRDRKKTEARFEAASKGVLDYQKTAYRSSVGDLDVPAYLFQPLQKRGPAGHAALVWVHGGVHSNLSETMFPFIREHKSLQKAIEVFNRI